MENVQEVGNGSGPLIKKIGQVFIFKWFRSIDADPEVKVGIVTRQMDGFFFPFEINKYIVNVIEDNNGKGKDYVVTDSGFVLSTLKMVNKITTNIA